MALPSRRAWRQRQVVALSPGERVGVRGRNAPESRDLRTENGGKAAVSSAQVFNTPGLRAAGTQALELGLRSSAVQERVTPHKNARLATASIGWRTLGRFVLALAALNMVLPAARSHDIPNQRVDRSIQVTVFPGRIEVDYEVSLSELTLTQDLRALSGSLPVGDRSTWLALYAQVTGPLDAKGLLVTVDGQPVSLDVQRYELVVEEHPRYTFHFAASVPAAGRLTVRDQNYISSEGTSRLAVRGRGGATVAGDDLPEDVDQIPARPVWQLSDDEERRTKQVTVRFVSKGEVVGGSLAGKNRPLANADKPTRPQADGKDAGGPMEVSPPGRAIRFSELLDETGQRSWIILAFLSVALGAAHAIQPGHGKMLVTSAALGPGARLYQPVLMVALALWVSGSARVGLIHIALARVAGFAIAAAGFWRLGRYVGGYEEHDVVDHFTAGTTTIELLGLGMAGGLVPCWDAVGLVVLAAAVGRLGAGVALVLAFSVGMAAVLMAVGWLAWKFKASAIGPRRSVRWRRGLGLAGGLVLSALGLYLFFQA